MVTVLHCPHNCEFNCRFRCSNGSGLDYLNIRRRLEVEGNCAACFATLYSQTTDKREPQLDAKRQMPEAVSAGRKTVTAPADSRDHHPDPHP